ncbi:MAG: exodeoxyribonuclease VII large subunit [Patescibacteria group bacterium]
MLSQEILTVSKYLDTVNAGLKAARTRILGEISGIQEYPGRSYMYYSVKDKEDGSTIKCFMWKNDYKISGVTLLEGVEVILTAYPAIYKPNGSLSLQVEHIEMVGEGALQMAYEKLKKKLSDEGLFSIDRKRKLPEYPNKIGVITSKSGAVIHDFLSNIGKFGYEVQFVDSKVEGLDAIKDLLLAVNTLKKVDIDVLVIMRGGGSLESFQAFNNEMLVRAVADFPVPVITGIGHDKDAPLVSMVSDKNVSTPTAVANILNKSWAEALGTVNFAEERIFSEFSRVLRDKQFLVENAKVEIQESFNSIFETFRKSDEAMARGISKIDFVLAEVLKGVERSKRDLEKGFAGLVSRAEEKLSQHSRSITQLSPERQLKRGYSIVKVGNKVLRSVKDVDKGDSLEVTVSDGIIKGTVK